MVAGLDRFRDRFATHLHQYALIGGSACDLSLEQAGLSFRATKDLDIVLLAEVLDAGFGRDFWAFIREGGYRTAQSEAGASSRYRFREPQAVDFPFMLEILSTRPESLGPAEGVHLTPIPFDDGVSRLSAIVMQNPYYAFLKAGIRQVEGISVVGPEHLIPLKARAWLDLTERRTAGQAVQSGDITKHRRDVFRLYRIADPAPLPGVPDGIRADMGRFIAETREDPVDLKGLGIAQETLGEALEQLRRIYGAG